MDAAMARHHEIIHGAVQAHGGFRPVDQGEGDAVFAAFRSATEAVSAVVQVQRELEAEPWPTSVPLTVRIGVHLGEVTERGGNVYGDPVNRCARLRGLGAGGQSLLSAAVYEVVRDRLPAGTSLTDLGEHRMKDLVRPEHVWQLDVDGLRSSFPPLSSLDRLNHNLPVQGAPFIGREAELANLVATVRDHRLVTLTGFGGMGKTRLALQAAAELAGEPGIGAVWFVDLAAVTDPELVPSRVAEAAGVRFGTGQPLPSLVEAFAGHPTLLVLDNLEQVTGCATFVADLVAQAPAVRVLATSREPLRIRSERQVSLASMSLPDPAGPVPSAEQLSAFEAVRFFVDRACAVRADFAVTNETAPAVAAICARLDGHPLALELAAARVKVLSVDKLLARLDSALGILTGGSRDMPERHQTLRATIAWSYDGLGPEEQLLLARMSVLPAPADYDLVEALAGEDLDVLDLLEVLVDRSLLRTVEVEGDTRYGLLVSIRDYAAEQLPQQQALACRQRHAMRVLELFSTPRSNWSSSGLTVQELPHLRAAMSHLRETGADADLVALVVAVEDGLYHAGLVLESLSWMQDAISRTNDHKQQAELALGLFMALAAVGRAQEARAAGFTGLEHARAGTDPDVHANLLVILVARAGTRPVLDDLATEYAVVRPLLDPAAALDFDGELANSLSAALARVDAAEAERVSRAALAAGLRVTAVHQVNLATTLMDQGRIDEAWSLLEHVQDPAVFQGMTAWVVTGVVATARARFLLGEVDDARALAQQAWEQARTLSLNPLHTVVLLAAIHTQQGHLQAALETLDDGLARLPEGAAVAAAQLRWRRGLLLHRVGREAEAAGDLTQAREVLANEGLFLLELVGCLAAESLLTTDPARAATLLGCIDAHRQTWALPDNLDHDLALLRAALAETHSDEMAAGRTLAPHHA